ncbi:transposase family protein [Nesterenkonia sp. MY13]|uniref:Transposase family protein n=1 Tax=Nesterenkonia sedimenti TaxID=1463632 RepID=A0A7X8TMJ7_9MICC|nr:transposase family protein [Nesterenkonia sedimenti]
MTDITEHHTGEGKLYLCAVKDACSRRIIGYSIDSRMKASVAVRALKNAIANRARTGTEVTGCIVRLNPPNFVPRSSSGLWSTTAWSDLWGAWALPGTTPPWSRSTACCRTTSSTPSPGARGKSFGCGSSPGSRGPITEGGNRRGWGVPLWFSSSR